jgi:hypothetical protein
MPVVQTSKKTQISQSIFDSLIVFVDQVKAADLLLLAGQSKSEGKYSF